MPPALPGDCYTFSEWRLEMHFLATGAAGYDAHRFVAAEFAGAYRVKPGIAGGKQRGLPAEQALGRQRLGESAGGVEQEVDQPIDGAGRRGQSGRRRAEMTRDRRADRVDIETLAFDGAGIDAFVDEDLRTGFAGKAGVEQRQQAEQPALLETRAGKRRDEGFFVPSERRPIGVLPDPLMHFRPIIAS